VKTITPTLTVCLLAVALAVVAAVADLGGNPSPSSVYAGTPTIAIQDFTFSTALVSPGADVTVHNADATSHTVTADDGSFNSDIVEAGTDGSFTAPTEPGTYAIHCTVHPIMTGDLVVASS
jgi:plastocyanin